MTRGDALVLDGDENQSVACVRDLSRAGYRVAVGDSVPLPKAWWSRHPARRIRYRSPRTDPDGFIRDLIDAIGPIGGTEAVLLPTTESTTLAVSVHRETLAGAGYRMVLPAHEELLVAFDKHRSGQLAASCGLRTPRQLFVHDEASLAQVRQLEHPVVIKAVSSNLATSSGLVQSPRPGYSLTPDETAQQVRALMDSRGSAIVQEFITGAGVGFFALYRHGTLERCFAHRRLRDVHPTGSGSSYRESIPVPPALQEAGTRLLDALRWHGAAMVEFKQRADGQFVFLEVNGRLWGSLALAVAAGATFPRWLAALARAEPLAPHPPIRAGVRARWIVGDVRHLVAVARGRPAGFPGPYPRLATTVRDMCRGLGSDHFDNLELGDPLPELGDWLSAARKAMVGKGAPT
ncbi:MAG: ATP-grasp domain-containing protein [Gemmatimonadaceae bacterium]